jgi:hypothetical protein
MKDTAAEDCAKPPLLEINLRSLPACETEAGPVRGVGETFDDRQVSRIHVARADARTRLQCGQGRNAVSAAKVENLGIATRRETDEATRQRIGGAGGKAAIVQRLNPAVSQWPGRYGCLDQHITILAS